VATPAYLQRHGTPKSPGDLVSHQAVIYTPGSGGEPWTSWTFRKATAEVSVVLRGRLKVTAGEGIREAVSRDLGLAVASEWNFSPELQSGKVVEILQDWALPLTNLSAVYPAGRLASTKARAFVAFVEQYMSTISPVSRRQELALAHNVPEAAGRHTQQARQVAVVSGR
jgi:DNA-binding transcriptional LysR family regulator